VGKIGCFAFKFANGKYNGGGTRVEYHVPVDNTANIRTCLSAIKTRDQQTKEVLQDQKICR